MCVVQVSIAVQVRNRFNGNHFGIVLMESLRMTQMNLDNSQALSNIEDEAMINIDYFNSTNINIFIFMLF